MPCDIGSACTCPGGRSRLKELCKHWTPGKGHRYYRCLQWQTERRTCHKSPIDPASVPGTLREFMERGVDRVSLVSLCADCPFFMTVKPPRGRPSVSTREPGESQADYTRRRKREMAKADRRRLKELSRQIACRRQQR